MFIVSEGGLFLPHFPATLFGAHSNVTNITQNNAVST